MSTQLTGLRWKRKGIHPARPHFLRGGGRDTPCTYTLFTVERDTPRHPSPLHCSRWQGIQTLHVHTAYGGKGYALHVHTAYGGKGYTLHVHTVHGGKGYTIHTLHVHTAYGEKG
jgi:hypothetical protein